MPFSRPLLGLMLLASAHVPGAAMAQANPDAPIQTLVAERLEEGERLRLDGTLDEAAWQRATPITDFVQREPTEGAAPSEMTEVRVLFDADNLYIGAMLHDREPERVIGIQLARDAGLGTDDRFMWILDTFLDGRSGYFFEINPAGLMGDGVINPGPNPGVNKSWDGIWETQVTRGDHGWSAEIRIPFRTLNFNPALDTWGINFQRTVRRKQEEIAWAGHLRNQSLFSPSYAGRLIGLRDISQGLGLEVKPFVTASNQRDLTGTTTPADVGFDLNYSVTPSLRASLTINTDFAEVEVDQRRVNLTRFPISYPERRDFFLEGAGVFTFAPANIVQPFFSRRIGLIGGDPVPIQYGARLAGQIGANEVGFFQVRAGGADDHPAETFTAARVVRRVLRQSTVGAVYTRRATDGAAADGGTFANHLFGTDLELVTSTFLGNRNLHYQLFFLGHTAGLGNASSSFADRTLYGTRLAYVNDPWEIRSSYRVVGTHYDPAVGFQARRAFRRVQPTIRYTPRVANHPYFRQLEFQIFYEHLMDMDFRPQTINLNLTPLGISFVSGDNITFGANRVFERLTDDFAIRPDIVVPPGDYTVYTWSVSGSTAGFRQLSVDGSISGGGFWSGTRTVFQSGFTLRPAPGFEVGSSWERNDVRLLEGDFKADLMRVSAGWNLSPWTSLTGNVQYDNLSELVGLYGRLRWIMRPGSDLYLVYSHNWLNEGDVFSTLSRSGATKLTYTHRF